MQPLPRRYEFAESGDADFANSNPTHLELTTQPNTTKMQVETHEEKHEGAQDGEGTGAEEKRMDSPQLLAQHEEHKEEHDPLLPYVSELCKYQLMGCIFSKSLTMESKLHEEYSLIY